MSDRRTMRLTAAECNELMHGMLDRIRKLEDRLAGLEPPSPYHPKIREGTKTALSRAKNTLASFKAQFEA